MKFYEIIIFITFTILTLLVGFTNILDSFPFLKPVCIILCIASFYYRFIFPRNKDMYIKYWRNNWSDLKKLNFLGSLHLFYFSNLDNLWFNRNAFSTTDTELKLIAAPAIIGLNNGPPKKCKTPIATGIPITL